MHYSISESYSNNLDLNDSEYAGLPLVGVPLPRSELEKTLKAIGIGESIEDLEEHRHLIRHADYGLTQYSEEEVV